MHILYFKNQRFKALKHMPMYLVIMKDSDPRAYLLMQRPNLNTEGFLMDHAPVVAPRMTLTTWKCLFPINLLAGLDVICISMARP